VDIDEASLAAVGQWPWPRYRLARLVQLIHESNPGPWQWTWCFRNRIRLL
jgi:hypothetical protein